MTTGRSAGSAPGSAAAGRPPEAAPHVVSEHAFPAPHAGRAALTTQDCPVRLRCRCLAKRFCEQDGAREVPAEEGVRQQLLPDVLPLRPHPWLDRKPSVTRHLAVDEAKHRAQVGMIRCLHGPVRLCPDRTVGGRFDQAQAGGPIMLVDEGERDG